MDGYYKKETKIFYKFRLSLEQKKEHLIENALFFKFVDKNIYSPCSQTFLANNCSSVSS